MWQLRKLSTNEALSEAGPLPNNWGPIFGLNGFKEKLGDLSWLGPAYKDMGWIELDLSEQQEKKKLNFLTRVESEKQFAKQTLSDPQITVEKKIMWSDYIIALDKACINLGFDSDTNIPARPNA